jgi:hypothetical protein
VVLETLTRSFSSLGYRNSKAHYFRDDPARIIWILISQCLCDPAPADGRHSVSEESILLRIQLGVLTS